MAAQPLSRQTIGHGMSHDSFRLDKVSWIDQGETFLDLSR